MVRLVALIVSMVLPLVARAEISQGPNNVPAADQTSIEQGSKSSLRIAKLRFVRPDIAIADIDAEVRSYMALPARLTATPDGVLRTKLMIVFVKEQGGLVDHCIPQYCCHAITAEEVRPPRNGCMNGCMR